MFRRKTGRETMDMCSGPLTGKILRFALPLILTGVLQLLYNAADIVVVGQFSGKEALAAVGATSALINLIVNLFMGLSVGASVAVARAWGAKDEKGVHQAVHTAVLVAGVCGLFLMGIGISFARIFLIWMGTPNDVIEGATLYMQIYFAGMPFNLLYNFCAAILRGSGDSKRPLYILTFSGLINVGLNLMFVLGFGMSVEGVALATIASQAVSVFLVFRRLMHVNSAIRLDLRKLKIDKDQFANILRVGLPAGLQSSLFSVSNVLIQSAINSFGSVTMAGHTAAGNLEGFAFTAMNSMQQADMTFTSQNMGAQKPERVKKILWICLGLVCCISTAIGLGLYFLGPVLLSIYNTDPQVIAMGMIHLKNKCLFHFALGTNEVCVGHLRGIGCSMPSMLISLAFICGLRVVWIYTVFAVWPTLECLFISYPVSWVLGTAGQLICYFAVRKRYLKTEAAVA